MAQDFQVACKADDVADGGKELVEVDDRLVIVFRVGDDFHCIDDVCTHDGGTLSDGEITGCEIACPRHGAKFDIRTGKAMCMPATENTLAHEVKVEDGNVMVKLTTE